MSKLPSRTHVSYARKVSLEVNRIVRERRAFVQEIIATHIDSNADLSVEDRGFATLLCLGVVSSVGTLDELIDRYVHTPATLDPQIRDVLRLSTYEIIFLNKSPYAAVDQGVELSKTVSPKVGGLINAVLRKIVAAKKEFPFGDPSTDLNALARLHAFPLWLTKKLVEDIGVQAAKNFMVASNEPAPIFLAVNFIKADIKEVQAVFSAADTPLFPVDIPYVKINGCLRLDDRRALQNPAVKRLFSEGKILVSDAASQAVAQIALPGHKPGSFFEIGTGRGTKTILLQNDAHKTFGSQMDLIACDSYNFKIDIHKNRMKEYGVNVSRYITEDSRALKKELGSETFDAVFLDAPCSGLGTLRRHPEIRWRLTPDSIVQLAQLQFEMLSEASNYVSPGGLLTYSTCTITKEENSNVIQRFLSSEKGSSFTLKKIGNRNSISTAIQKGSSDAHFAVNMERKH